MKSCFTSYLFDNKFFSSASVPVVKITISPTKGCIGWQVTIQASLSLCISVSYPTAPDRLQPWSRMCEASLLLCRLQEEAVTLIFFGCRHRIRQGFLSLHTSQQWKRLHDKFSQLESSMRGGDDGSVLVWWHMTSYASCNIFNIDFDSYDYFSTVCFSTTMTVPSTSASTARQWYLL